MSKPIQLLADSRERYGPAPRFAGSDLVRALWRLERRTGRARLASELGIGEGSMRTILNRLSRLKLIDSAPMGHKLTKNGFSCLRRMRGRVVALGHAPASKLTFGLPALAMQLRRPARAAKPVQLRDEAVRAGAVGCTLLRFEAGRLIIPPFHAPTHREYARELAALERAFSLSDGDALVVAYGGSEATRERALWRIFTRL